MRKSPPQAAFQVSPKMTKTEVKEYLTKIYNINVEKVNTVNVLGKFKRLYAARRVLAYKRRNTKIAYVDIPCANETEKTQLHVVSKLVK